MVFLGKQGVCAWFLDCAFSFFGFFGKTRRFCILYLVHSEQHHFVLSAFRKQIDLLQHWKWRKSDTRTSKLKCLFSNWISNGIEANLTPRPADWNHSFCDRFPFKNEEVLLKNDRDLISGRRSQICLFSYATCNGNEGNLKSGHAGCGIICSVTVFRLKEKRNFYWNWRRFDSWDSNIELLVFLLKF